MPLNRQLGSDACFENGEPFAEALPQSSIFNGFNQACFRSLPVDTNDFDIASAFTCSLQFFYATIIAGLYEQDSVSIAAAFALLLPEAIVTFHAGTPTRTDVVTAITPTYSVAVTDGTNTFQQGAMQAFLAIQRPTDIGALSTFPFWNDNADWLHGHLRDDGADPTAPVFLCGHSYGGVTASILAARYRAAQPRRQIRCLTFGSPKPGDQRLQDLLKTVQMLSMANTGDIVTSLPPNFIELAPVQISLGLTTLGVWASWIREPSRQLQHSDGSLTPSGGALLDFATLLALANNAISGTNPGPVLSHPIGEYRRRINVRCPLPEWPVSPALHTFLNTFTVFQLFTTAGAGSWTCPFGVTSATVEAWGAGSVGGPHVGFVGGIGGGGGAYARSVVATIPGNVYTFFIGDGGLPPPVANGQTNFNAGQVVADCAGHGHPGLISNPGLATRSVGTVKFDGGFGGIQVAGIGGGGGSSAGDDSKGHPYSHTPFTSGAPAPPAGGGGGIGGNPGIRQPARGTQPGGGGGGAGGGAGQTIALGGNGMLKISW